MKKILLLFIFSITTTFSQSLTVFDVDASNFPMIKGKFYALDKDGNQFKDHQVSDFEVKENNQVRKVIKVNSSVFKHPTSLSSVLVFDVSSSMRYGFPRIQIAKDAANAWVDYLPKEESECAIISFSNSVMINHDFTNDKQAIKMSIEKLKPMYGTNYNHALIDLSFSGLKIAQTGKYKKVLIFMTDGQSNTEVNTSLIVKYANDNDIPIFAITLDMPAPQSLKDIAIQSGGQFFENVATTLDAKNIYIKLLKQLQGIDPFEIEWQSEISCISDRIEANFKYLPLNLTSNVYYNIPQSSIARLEFNPNFFKFDNPEPGVKTETIVSITAKNADFIVTNIRCENPSFTISPTDFELKASQTKDLKISYLPIDKNYVYSKFEFESNICPTVYYASGGSKGIPPKHKSLMITKPNNGDILIAGGDSNIAWEGIPDTDTISLEYFCEGELYWKPITNTASGLNFNWKNIPKSISSNCKIRAKQQEKVMEIEKPGAIIHDLRIHTESIRKVLWNPDGSKIATIGNDKLAFIWDANEGNIVKIFHGHTDKITDINWSPDGNRIATSSTDSTCIIWEASTGKILQRLTVYQNFISKIIWSPDGKKIATVSQYGNLCTIWDAETGNLLLTLTGHKDRIANIAWCQDGTKLTTISYDKTSIVWDAITGNISHILKGHTNVVTCVSWSPDGTKIATGSLDKTSIIWDANTGLVLKNLIGHNAEINDLNWSPDGTRLATSGNNNIGIIWDALKGDILFELSGHSKDIKQICWSPDGNDIATSSLDNSVMIWETFTGTIKYSLNGHFNGVNYISWRPDGNRIAAASGDVNVFIWNPHSGNKLVVFDKGHTSIINSIRWSPDGSKIATAGDDRVGIIWDVLTGQVMKRLVGHSDNVNNIRWSPDGSKLATGSDDKTGIIWDALKGEILLRLVGHISNINQIIWSPDGNKVATSSDDKSIIIWDGLTGNILHTLKAHKDKISKISWSPDGSKIASSSSDKTSIIWDVNTGNIVFTLLGHNNSVNNISWSPDGNKIATSSNDKTGIIWDAITGLKLHTLKIDSYSALNICWSPDGNKIAMVQNKNSATIWDANLGVIIHKLDHDDYLKTIDWSPDGKKVVSIGNDNKCIIWDAETGLKLFSLTGHSSTINDINWSPDGNRLATCSMDKTGKIWFAGNIPILQEAESDRFSIEKPILSTNDIYMQRCSTYDNKDTVVHNFIYNTGKLKCRVDSIFFRGDDASAFSLVTVFQKFELMQDQGKDIEIRFKSKESRLYQSDLIIITQMDTIIRKILGESVSPEITVNPGGINFRKVPLKHSKTFLDTIIIRNKTKVDIQIDSVLIIGDDYKQFEILNEYQNIILKANESKRFSIRFNPVKEGRTTCYVAFYHKSFTSPSIFKIDGEAIDIKPKLNTNSPVCGGDGLILYADSIDNAQFFWFGPNNFSSTDQITVISDVNNSHSGKYFAYTKFENYFSDTTGIDVLVTNSDVSPGEKSFIFKGSAVSKDSFMQITKPRINDFGSVWLKKKFSVKKDFSISFKFRSRNGQNNIYDDGMEPGADGFALVFQNNYYPLFSQNSGSIGYNGITNSIAIEIDLFKNIWDENGNHIAIQTLKSDGNQSDHRISESCLGMDKNIIKIKHDRYYYCKVDYSWYSKVLKIYIDSTEKFVNAALIVPDFDFVQYLNLENDEFVFVGITSTTGEAYQNHDIKDWSFPCNNLLLSNNNEIELEEIKTELLIYPNPTSSSLNLNLNKREDVQIIIVNSLGIEVYKENVNSSWLLNHNNYLLNLEALPQGVYYLKLKTEKEMINEMIIKVN